MNFWSDGLSGDETKLSLTGIVFFILTIVGCFLIIKDRQLADNFCEVWKWSGNLFVGVSVLSKGIDGFKKNKSEDSK